MIFVIFELGGYDFPVSYHKTLVGAYKELRKRVLENYNVWENDRMRLGKKKTELSFDYDVPWVPKKPYELTLKITRQRLND